MAHLLSRRVPYVCKSCKSAQAARPLFRAFSTSISRPRTLQQQLADRGVTPKKASRTAHSKPAEPLTRSEPVRQSPAQAVRQDTAAAVQIVSPGVSEHDQPDIKVWLKKIQEEVLSILESETTPAEAKVVRLLQDAEQLATVLVNTQPETQQKPQAEQEAAQPKASKTSLLGDLDESQPQSRAVQKSQPNPFALSHSDQTAASLSLIKTLYTLLEDPKLFISESILTSYVQSCITLSLPQYLPKIFHLYARKPIPKLNSNPISYTTPNPRAPKYAVPLSLASAALDSAIKARDMPLCISIIETTVATPSYRSSKFIRRALLPLAGAATVVPLTYALASRAAAAQVTWDPKMFFWMCMVGATSYVGTMYTLLFITVTTWNDHHKRVRWVPGTPLGQRWLREDERAFFDRVAIGFGFVEEERWGEEGGEEWEAFKERCGESWMQVDRSSLLPGML